MNANSDVAVTAFASRHAPGTSGVLASAAFAMDGVGRTPCAKSGVLRMDTAN